jgi:hypothetical protein
MGNMLQETNCIIFVNVLNQVFEGSVLLQESKPGPVKMDDLSGVTLSRMDL